MIPWNVEREFRGMPKEKWYAHWMRRGDWGESVFKTIGGIISIIVTLFLLAIVIGIVNWVVEKVQVDGTSVFVFISCIFAFVLLVVIVHIGRYILYVKVDYEDLS